MSRRVPAQAAVRAASAGLERHALALVGLATGAILLVAFYYPVATVLVEALSPVPANQLSIPGVLTSRFSLETIFGFTAYQAALSTVASVLVGLSAAWILARFEFPGRRTIRSLTILPFVLPSIMVAIGFVATFGTNGTLTRALSVLGLPPLRLLFTVEATAISLGLVYAYLRYEAHQRGTSRGARPLPRRSLWPDSLSGRSLGTRLAIAGYALIALVLFVGPLASMVFASITTGDGALTLRHYEFLLRRQAEGAAFQVRPLPAVRNSLLLGGGTLVVALPMGLTVAVFTARRYRGRKVVDALAMAPIAISGIVVGLGLLRGLVFGVEIGGWRITAAGRAAILAAHAVAAYPFVTRNVAPMLERLDPSLVESARSLGASRSRAPVDVELPLVWGGVVAGAAFAFAISIGEFNSTVILAQGAGQYTMPVERFIARRLGPATAMGCILLAVTACSFVVIDRFGGYGGGGL